MRKLVKIIAVFLTIIVAILSMDAFINAVQAESSTWGLGTWISIDGNPNEAAMNAIIPSYPNWPVFGINWASAVLSVWDQDHGFQISVDACVDSTNYHYLQIVTNVWGLINGAWDLEKVPTITYIHSFASSGDEVLLKIYSYQGTWYFYYSTGMHSGAVDYFYDTYDTLVGGSIVPVAIMESNDYDSANNAGTYIHNIQLGFADGSKTEPVQGYVYYGGSQILLDATGDSSQCGSVAVDPPISGVGIEGKTQNSLLASNEINVGRGISLPSENSQLWSATIQKFRLLAVEGPNLGTQSGQYLIRKLLQYPNWNNQTHESYIHLLSNSDPECIDEAKPYLVGTSTKDNVQNEIINFLGAGDSNELDVFYCNTHGSVGILSFDQIVSADELSSWFGAVKGTLCVILDSCDSGSFIDDGSGGILGIPGRIVLCSSRGDQLSYNVQGNYPGGVFGGFESLYYSVNQTYLPWGLIGGMMAGTDKNDDGWLSVQEVFDYANISMMLDAGPHQDPVYYNGLGSDPPLIDFSSAETVTVRGLDNGIYLRCRKGTGWQDWLVLPGSTDDSVATAMLGTELHLVVRGSDGTSLWHGYLRNPRDASTFSGWTLISGATPSAPALASNGNALCLVVRGLDNRIYFRWYGSNHIWGDWHVVPTGATLDSPAAAISVYNLHIVVRGMDGHSLWDTIISFDGSVIWPWMQISGATPSKPVLVNPGGEYQWLIVRGMDNRIYYRSYASSLGPASDWGDWNVVPSGSTIDAPGVTVISNMLRMVVRGSDGNTLWCEDVGLGTGSFPGWTLLNGATHSAPSL